MRSKALLVGVIASSRLLASTPASAQSPEICGNGIDDDGNGLTDEGCYPTLTTGVCESPLSCGDTGMVSWKNGSLHYDLPPDIAPAVPFGPGVGFRRFYTSMYSPASNPASVNHMPLGPNWQHTYLTFVYLTGTGTSQKIVLHTSQGRDVLYTYSFTDVNKWDNFTPQFGDHVMSLKHNTAGPNQFQVQLLTGETIVYNSAGQLSEIWDTLGPTPNKVLVTWDSTTSGNVSTVTDANGRRRLLFSYSSGLMSSVQFQTFTSPTWTTQHTTSFAYTSGVLTSTTIGSQLAQQYTYTSSYLTKIQDGANNQVAAFAYSSSTNGQVDRVDTSRGTVGFEYSSSRTGCTSNTMLYFNKGNSTSCSVDSDCGTGFLCGGKTGSGTNGTCFLAGRCLTTSTVNNESVITNVAPIGPGGTCTGACTDVMQYVWANASTGLINVIGREDALTNFTAATYNSNGLPTQIWYGATDSTGTSANRTVTMTYDTVFPGRVASVSRTSDLSAGTAQTNYCYVSSCPSLPT